MKAIQVFEYEGTQIEFDLSKINLMVNATEMAKPFGKLIPDFMRLESTKSFIEAALNNGNPHYLGIEKESDSVMNKKKADAVASAPKQNYEVAFSFFMASIPFLITL